MKRKTLTAELIAFSFDGLEDVTLDPRKCSASVNEYARLMGLQDRMKDSAALSRKQKDGSVIAITEKMRRDEMVRVRDHLETGGAWEMGRKEFIDPRAVKLAEAKGISVDEAKQILAKIEMDALAAAMA